MGSNIKPTAEQSSHGPVPPALSSYFRITPNSPSHHRRSLVSFCVAVHLQSLGVVLRVLCPMDSGRIKQTQNTADYGASIFVPSHMFTLDFFELSPHLPCRSPPLLLKLFWMVSDIHTLLPAETIHFVVEFYFN